jgi:hypothetical protein
MTEEEITKTVENDPEYQLAVEQHTEVKRLYDDIQRAIDDILTTIGVVSYNVINENVVFRGTDWASSYRGFTGLPCPSCKRQLTFRDGKCATDGTDQYVSEDEKRCAADGFVHGIAPPIDPELRDSGYSMGYMGVNVKCPGCSSSGSYRDGQCFVCRTKQYPPGTTNADVLKMRNAERQKKCYNNVLDLPCPSCGGVETFIYTKCFVCRFGQYEIMTPPVPAEGPAPAPVVRRSLGRRIIRKLCKIFSL